MLAFALYAGPMNALDALRQHTAKERAHKLLGDRLAAERELLVESAFNDGHSGPEVGAAAGCSKERAYQIRNDAAESRRLRELAARRPNDEAAESA